MDPCFFREVIWQNMLLCLCSPCIGRGEPSKLEQTPMGFMPSTQLAEQMRRQSAASCESLDDEAGTGASIASLRSANSSWEMNSWELDASEVQICLDSKNRPWQLGSGGFGSVSSPPFTTEIGLHTASVRKKKRFLTVAGYGWFWPFGTL